MKKIFITLLIVSFITRLFFLIWGHPSLTHDEADFFYNGYLISKTGSDIYGHKLFFTTGILSAAPNVPNYISTLAWNMFQSKEVFYARLPFAFFNSFSPVLFAIIVYLISQKLIFALIAFCVFNFSPWFLNISVTAGFDSPLGLLFVLLSVLCLLTFKSKLKLACFILFNFLAFNSYMGFRIISPFIMTFQIYFFIVSKKMVHTRYGLLFDIVKSSFFALILFILFLIPVQIFPNTSHFQNRALNDVIFTNKDIVGNEIWYANFTSSSQLVGRVYANKIFTPAALFLKKWLHTFDMTSIFAGETHPIYGMRIAGLFYMTDIFIFVLGILFFSKLFPRKLNVFLLLFTFAGLPFAINPQGVTIALRGIFLIIPYTLLISNGYWYLFLKHKVAFSAVAVLFIINIISLSLLYIFRIRVMSSEAFHATDKIVIEEVETSPETIHIFPYEYRPFVLLYGFYSSENPEAIKGELNSKTDFAFTNTRGNLVFHKSCDDFQKIASNELVLIHGQACDKYQKPDALKVEKTYGSKDMSGQILFTLGRKI